MYTDGLGADSLGTNAWDMSLPLLWEYCMCLGRGGGGADLAPTSKLTLMFSLTFKLIFLQKMIDCNSAP